LLANSIAVLFSIYIVDPQPAKSSPSVRQLQEFRSNWLELLLRIAENRSVADLVRLRDSLSAT
jgi:hypothetical protein